jgi:hypothetical protein
MRLSLTKYFNTVLSIIIFSLKKKNRGHGVGCTHFQTCTDDAEMCDMTREEMKEIGTKIVELEEKRCSILD